MRWDAVIEFPKMKVAVVTREARVTGIRYLPLLIEGTQFQRRLWDALCAIPRGRTLTYGEMARKLGGEARAVGQACGDNKLPIVIPCHRVVAAAGIGGFSHSTGGYLIEAKRWLLMHESSADAFQLTS